MRFAVSLAAGLIGLAVAGTGPALAQSRTYDVTGTNPGGAGAGYTGTVTMTATGDVVTVTWVVDGQQVVGTGIIAGNTMAVGYPDGEGPGVALYTRDPATGIVTGRWVPGGGQALGTERWTPQR